MAKCPLPLNHISYNTHDELFSFQSSYRIYLLTPENAMKKTLGYLMEYVSSTKGQLIVQISFFIVI